MPERADQAVVVIDTNIVLDLFVFSEAAALPLKAAIAERAPRWLATLAMRDELERVLGYPQIARRMAFYSLAPSTILADFDRHAELTDTAAKAPVTCGDADDQKFIDLAVAHRALLISKDREVLCMRKRLLALGADAIASWVPADAA